MAKIIGAVAAVFTLAMATQAAADVVVYEESGHALMPDFYELPLPGSGKYRVEFTSSVPVNFYFGRAWEQHWDIFRAPAPKPHGEFIDGNSSYYTDGVSGVGASGSWELLIPETTYTYFSAPDWYADVYGVPEGTPLYQEDKYEAPRVSFNAVYNFEDAFDYTFKVTLLSAVPEPATWAMMIAGFGMIGGAIRGRRRLAFRTSASSPCLS